MLFFKYEDLIENPSFHLNKLAEFITQEEENEGVIKKIVDFCSINNLKELEINKNASLGKIFENRTFFRNGHVISVIP
uniref:Sulfotransferase n=1 Tax=Chenopodium quinoa TaxID=63459 RepID=A0A803MZX1_CHEQI